MTESRGAVSSLTPAGPLAAARPMHDGRRTVVLIRRTLTDDAPQLEGWAARVRSFAAAGWATHVVVIRDDPTLPATVETMRAAGRLPLDTSVRCFARRDRRIRASWWALLKDGEPVAARVADWLDWYTGRIPGAVVIVDEPEAYPYVSAMSNPLVARVAGTATDPSGWPRGAPISDLDLDLDPAKYLGSRVTPTDPPAPAELLAGFEALVASDAAVATQVRATAAQPGELVIIADPDTDQDGGSAWVALAQRLGDTAWDRHSPILLVESLSTLQRVLRLTGFLAGSTTQLSAWTCTLAGLVDPAGTLAAATAANPAEGPDDELAPAGAEATGSMREVVVSLRSNALAYIAARGDSFRLEFSDGSSTVPLLSTAFDPRVIASRAGNATMVRQSDGGVLISPLPEVVVASDADGRQLVRAGGGRPTDITHALRWWLEIDWSDVSAAAGGARFAGVLCASRIAPGDPPPMLCVADVAGYSREVGPMHYTAAAEISGTSWRRPVSGVLAVDPLVATTSIAGGELALHLGVRGATSPVGELRIQGPARPILLSCRRGRVTLLPAADGQVLILPGGAYRVRAQWWLDRARQLPIPGRKRAVRLLKQKLGRG